MGRDLDDDHLRDQLSRLAQIVERVARQQVETWRMLRDLEHKVRQLESPNPDITLP